MSGRLHELALPLVVVVLVVGAGCTGGPGYVTPEKPMSTAPEPTTQPTPSPTLPPTETPDSSRETLEPKAFPWKPDPLVAGNVEMYVQEYERTVRYNELIGPKVTEVELRCRATLVADTSQWFVVRAECGGSIHSQSDDGATSVGGFAPERVTYVLDGSSIRRIDGTDHEVEPYRGEDGENVASPGAIKFVNADDREHELDLVVRYDDQIPVLERRYNLTPTSGIDLDAVAAREGTYNVTAELTNGTSAQYRWRVVADEGGRSDGIAIVVMPDANVLVIDIPRTR